MELRTVKAQGLKGLYHFTEGLAFDFSALPEGVIAIVGGNGQGKSTLLELPIAAFYQKFPSRPDAKLIDAVDGRNAFLDVELDCGARGVYRARVNVDGIARTADAVLERRHPDGTIERVNDGKISTFKDAIAREFPSLTFLQASAFADQLRTGSFRTAGKAECRALFAELLGLALYEQRATTCRAAALVIEKRVDGLRTLIAHLAPRTTDAEALAIGARGNQLQVALSTADLAVRRAGEALHARETAVVDLRVAAARFIAADEQHRAHIARRVDRALELDRIAEGRRQIDLDGTRESGQIASRRELAIQAAQLALAAIQTPPQIDAVLERQLASVDRTLATRRADVAQRIANNRDLLDRETEIREAATQLRTAESALATAKTSAREAETVHLEAERAYTQAHQHRATATAALDRLTADRQRAGWLDGVPCHGDGPYAGCRFLVDAVKARDAVQELAESIEATAAAAADALTAAETARERAHDRSRDCRQRVAQLELDVASWRPTAERRPILDAARARVADLEAGLATFEQEADTQRADAREGHIASLAAAEEARRQQQAAISLARQYAVHEQDELAARQATARTALADRHDALQAELTALDQTIASLAALRDQHAGAKAALETAETALIAARTDEAVARQALTRLDAEIEAFEHHRATFIREQAQRLELEGTATTLETEQIEWAILAKALGREGLPTLEIDAAGPGVTALANDLLQACFGARFSVQIVTQVPTTDGKGVKEVFEVQVFDGERGGETKDLRLLSGGEAVIVDEALKSAVSAYVNQRGDFRIGTIWRDETIGALDAENAVRYVAMLRRLRERTGVKHVFFIAHNADAAALADAQLTLTDGTIVVSYPPFTQAAA